MPIEPAFSPQTAPPMCDLQAGLCQIADLLAEPGGPALPSASPAVVHYVGDPMCSWCWGISPAVKGLEAHCRARGIGFSITVGGLRAGGGDAWNAVFKDFLRREWTHIAQVTGQPFGMALLERGHFDYDTEPACRAVVAARAVARDAGLPETTALAFFSAVQRGFYVDGADPKEVDFYRGVCASVGIAFEAFAAAFASAATVRQTGEEFMRCRQMGVHSFPSVLVEVNGQLDVIGRGFTTEKQLLDRLESALSGS